MHAWKSANGTRPTLASAISAICVEWAGGIPTPSLTATAVSPRVSVPTIPSVSQSVIQNRILTNPAIDAQGKPTYRLATVGSGASAKLVSKTFQTNAAIADVYVMMLSFRYRFN